MKTLNDYAYCSKIRDFSPEAKLAFGLLFLTACLILDCVGVSVFLAGFMAVISIHYSKASAVQYFGLLSVPAVFALLAALPIVVTSGGNLWFSIQLGGTAWGVSRESAAQGVRVALKIVGCVSCVYFISLNTSMTDILSVLRRLHLPGFLLTIAELLFRYLFVLWEEAGRIMTAQRCRLGYCGVRRSIRSFAYLTGMLFFRAYQRSGRVYQSLESRGYSGELPVLDRPREKASVLCVWLMAGIAGTMLLAAWEKGAFAWI